MSNQVIEHTAKPIVARDADQTFALLQQAVQQGTSPESLEKLVELQERILAHEARKAYGDALSQFQASCPAIVKSHQVRDRGGRVMYKFAPLEDIIAQIKGLLSSLGLSYAFDTVVDEKNGTTITCTIRHRDGHSESSSVYVPATQGHNTNAAQNMGIQLSYGKRYALIGALGITTADEDNDAATMQFASISADQASKIHELIISSGSDEAAFLKYLGADSVEDIQARDYDRAISALAAKARSKK